VNSIRSCTLPTTFCPEDWPRFIHGAAFEKKWSRLGLGDEDLRALEIAIMLGPRRPPVVPKTGGMRKIRFGGEKSGRGKSGAFRIYYAYFQGSSIVLLAAVFGKNEADDLSDAGKAAMASLIREIESQLEGGQIR
jgi:mRNA-degrading endonuclease RelE of RelBE toxin-antitoxin system